MELSMNCNFQVGQRVLCVDASTSEDTTWDFLGGAPREGEIYTIRAMVAGGAVGQGVPMISLYFHEIRRGEWAGVEYGYWHVRFRALEEKKHATDISVLTALLESCKELI